MVGKREPPKQRRFTQCLYGDSWGNEDSPGNQPHGMGCASTTKASQSGVW